MNEGDQAPDFELTANDKSVIRLESLRGNKNLVLCFYPKNHLFACPSKKVFKMAQSVISAYPDIISRDATLFAISIDSVESQAKFVDKFAIYVPDKDILYHRLCFYKFFKRSCL